MYYQLFKRLLFAPVVRWLLRARIEGQENVPETGGAILASNHLAAGDTFVMPALIDRQVIFPAKAELFAGNRGLGSKIIAWFLKAVGQVPLDRSGGRVSLDGLGPVLKVLRDGGLVGIYPEGTRSPDGTIAGFKPGLWHLASAVPEAELVPVYLQNLNRILPKGHFLPIPLLSTVVFGKPIRVEPGETKPGFLHRSRQALLGLVPCPVS